MRLQLALNVSDLGEAVDFYTRMFGVETETADEVVAAESRLGAAGLETTGIDDTVCCYAEKTETWVHGPDGARWEWYVKNADADQLVNTVVSSTVGDQGTCCPA